MDWTDIFEIELQFYDTCKDYIEGGSTPKDEEMEACYKAFAAVQDYRSLVQENEKSAGLAPKTDENSLATSIIEE
jgi:hypothetical protein